MRRYGLLSVNMVSSTFSISAVFDNLNLHNVPEGSVLVIQIFITHPKTNSVSYYYGCWVALTKFCRVKLSKKKISNICYVYVIWLFMQYLTADAVPFSFTQIPLGVWEGLRFVCGTPWTFLLPFFVVLTGFGTQSCHLMSPTRQTVVMSSLTCEGDQCMCGWCWWDIEVATVWYL